MKSKHVLPLLLSFLAFCAFMPGAEDPVERLAAALQKWSDANPQEKVYLQTDKPYYAVGDTLWFKAYLTVGSRHQPSKLSGALYVELINERDSLVSSLKLPVTGGMAMGDFTIDDGYTSGNYRLRAYTQWMRNAGEDYFFDRHLLIGDPLDLQSGAAEKTNRQESTERNAAQRKTAVPDSLSGADIQFFPEGGTLVNNVATRIGFKAVATTGRGVAVKGTVLDDNGTELGKFESQYAGMGVFSIRPEPGRRYSAKLSFGDGSSKTVALPVAQNQGYVLGVYQMRPDSLLVRINTDWAQQRTPQPLGIIAQSSGTVIYAAQLMVSKQINSFWLSKKDFPSGIAQFTLFSDGGEPIAERLTFIKNDDHMQLALTGGKTSYSSRDRVELTLQASDAAGNPVAGNFSVAIIDEDKVPSDENTETSIFSSLLLSSELKGYIETPNYYFNGNSTETDKALDNLMLTQGYRKFVWKDLQNITAAQAKPIYRAESLGTALSGRVLTLSGKPVVNGTVTLMSLSPGFMEQVKTDADGRFSYAPLVLGDSLKFALQGRTAKNGKKVEIILDEVSRQGISIHPHKPDYLKGTAYLNKTYLENSNKQDELRVRLGQQGRVNRLKEVRIRAARADRDQMSTQGVYQIPEGHADYSYKIPESEVCATLGICLQGRLGSVVFQPYPLTQPTVMNYPYYRNSPLQTFLNGRRIDALEAAEIYDQNSIEPKDIIRIDVLTNNQALMSIVNGPAVFIYTRKSRIPRYNPGTVNIKPKGFNNAREFYSPRYDRPNISQQLPDLRSTIYWNPKLKTYANGRTSFSYFNADGPGRYKVIVEGINAAGELGRAVYRYEVTGNHLSAQPQLPDPGTGTQAAVKAMQKLHQRMPAEKLYLHTDKPYYNIGDTIWFKAYLFDGSSLAASKKSGLLYVELNDDTAETVRRISIPVKEGIGYAQIALERSVFHEGGYTLRAYTNWMQNFGPGHFFTQRLYLGVPTSDTWLVKSRSEIIRNQVSDQLETELLLSRPDQTVAGLRDVSLTIMEGDRVLKQEKLQTSADGRLHISYPLKDKTDGRKLWLSLKSLHPSDNNQQLVIPLYPERIQKTDLQFLPEGGYLVAGLPSRVGFKAVSENGMGMAVSGKVYDSRKTAVASFRSLYKGAGSFDLTPLAGETYTARLDGSEDRDASFALPAVQNQGTVMKVTARPGAGALEVSISATEGILDAGGVWTLVGLSRGVVTYSAEVNPGNLIYQVPKHILPNGITEFTLLKDQVPLNRRMVFVDQQDQLQFSIVKNKPAYLKRDSVSLDLVVKDKYGEPIKGSFSLAVTDDSQVNPDSLDNYGILPRLLLSSDIKGTVETPGYYFNSKDTSRLTALDNLMLTQGWAGYDWKEAFQAPSPIKYDPERSLRIRGTVTNVVNKPVPGAQMLISSQKPVFINTTITDSAGRYVFENLPPVDSGSFFIQARTPKGRTMHFGAVTVEQFSPPRAPESLMNPISPWYVNTSLRQLNYVRNAKLREDEAALKLAGIPLKQVEIRDKKIIKNSENRNGPGRADMVFDEADIKKSTTTDLYQLLKQKLPGLKVVYDENMPTILWNGYHVVVGIDGGALPVSLNMPPGPDMLIDALRSFTVQNMKGMEVMYSRKYIRSKYTQVMPGGTDRYIPAYHPRDMDIYLESRAMGPNKKDRPFAFVEITTANGRGWFRSSRPDFATLRPLPVMQPAEFYSPKYTASNKDLAAPDYRATIYWKPDVVTDSAGRAKISFYTSDQQGNYTLNIQGADMDGRAGSLRDKIKVVPPSTSLR